MSRDLRWAQHLAKPNLPKYVLHVMRTVASSSKFDGISNRSREVLYYLSSLVDTKTRDATIFATKETIARNTGCSEPTVYRALREIEENGLIFRNAQKFNPDSGFFRIGEIQFAEKFYEIVGHPVKPDSTPPQAGESQQTAAAGACAAAPKPTQGEALQESPSINVIDNTQIKNPYQKQKISNASPLAKPGNRLPESLRWLVDQGLMTDRQVINVMWKAKQAKQRLQDLLDVKRHVIESGQIRNLPGYLWKLLDSGDDYGYVARKAREDATHQQQAASLSNELQDLLSGMAGKVLRLATGGVFRRDAAPDGFLEFYDAEGSRRGVCPTNLSWFEQIKARGYELVDEAIAVGGAA